MMNRNVAIPIVMASAAIVEFAIQEVSTMLKYAGAYDSLEWIVVKVSTIFVFASIAQFILYRGSSLDMNAMVRSIIAGVAIGGLLQLAYYLFVISYGILRIIDILASVGGFFVELLLSTVAIGVASGSMRLIMRKFTR